MSDLILDRSLKLAQHANKMRKWAIQYDREFIVVNKKNRALYGAYFYFIIRAHGLFIA